MKKMQDEYWVAKAGPASDLTQMKVCCEPIAPPHGAGGPLRQFVLTPPRCRPFTTYSPLTPT